VRLALEPLIGKLSQLLDAHRASVPSAVGVI
jgi:hypothetical protein